MAKVTYGDSTTRAFYTLSAGDYFIYSGKLYLKLNHAKIQNALDFEKDQVVTFTEDATIIFKSGADIEINVIR